MNIKIFVENEMMRKMLFDPTEKSVIDRLVKQFTRGMITKYELFGLIEETLCDVAEKDDVKDIVFRNAYQSELIDMCESEVHERKYYIGSAIRDVCRKLAFNYVVVD